MIRIPQSLLPPPEFFPLDTISLEDVIMTLSPQETMAKINQAWVEFANELGLKGYKVVGFCETRNVLACYRIEVGVAAQAVTIRTVLKAWARIWKSKL